MKTFNKKTIAKYAIPLAGIFMSLSVSAGDSMGTKNIDPHLLLIPNGVESHFKLDPAYMEDRDNQRAEGNERQLEDRDNKRVEGNERQFLPDFVDALALNFYDEEYNS